MHKLRISLPWLPPSAAAFFSATSSSATRFAIAPVLLMYSILSPPKISYVHDLSLAGNARMTVKSSMAKSEGEPNVSNLRVQRRNSLYVSHMALGVSQKKDCTYIIFWNLLDSSSVEFSSAANL
jgi:hypothetical protein